MVQLLHLTMSCRTWCRSMAGGSFLHFLHSGAVHWTHTGRYWSVRKTLGPGHTLSPASCSHRALHFMYTSCPGLFLWTQQKQVLTTSWSNIHFDPTPSSSPSIHTNTIQSHCPHLLSYAAPCWQSHCPCPPFLLKFLRSIEVVEAFIAEVLSSCNMVPARSVTIFRTFFWSLHKTEGGMVT